MRRLLLLLVALPASFVAAGPAAHAQTQPQPKVRVIEPCTLLTHDARYGFLLLRVEGLSPGEAATFSATDVTSEPPVSYGPFTVAADESGLAQRDLAGGYVFLPYKRYTVSISVPSRAFSSTAHITFDCYEEPIDSLPPTLTVPDQVVADATAPSGTKVLYTVSATDNLDPHPVVNCQPPAGSTFPIGATKVTCTATDEAGNLATGTFNVKVKALVPTTAYQCKHGGWRSYSGFKNQGRCVAFVVKTRLCRVLEHFGYHPKFCPARPPR